MQLDPVEPVAGGLADHLQLPVGRLGGGAGPGVGVDDARGQGRVEPDDVGVAPHEGEHPRPAAADHDRRTRLLDRLGLTLQTVHLVVAALELDRPSDHIARMTASASSSRSIRTPGVSIGMPAEW